MFDTYQAGKSFTLKRNPYWSNAIDPNRSALPDNISVKLNVDPEDVDQQLLNGSVDVDVTSGGLQTDTQGQVVTDPSLKANADLAPIPRLWFASINPDVAPLDNIDCRKAVELAADHDGFLRAFGGQYGGEIATSVMPPLVPGATKADPYNFLGKKNGDADAAKAELTKCGQPSGFSINMAYRGDRPKEQAEAEALQNSLGKVGIKLTLKPFPSGDYFKLYAGNPTFAKNNNLGISANGWGADWPDGYGFLAQIVDSRAIKPSGGNSNMSVKDPQVDALLDKALGQTDVAQRNQTWGQIDAQVMSDAVILPGVWASVLLYRPKNLTNVFVNNGFGGYDYTQLGVSS